MTDEPFRFLSALRFMPSIPTSMRTYYAPLSDEAFREIKRNGWARFQTYHGKPIRGSRWRDHVKISAIGYTVITRKGREALADAEETREALKILDAMGK
jgi:hypothetical protein